MNKNYTNLIYANPFKTRICRSIISVIQKQKQNTIEYIKHKKKCFGCTIYRKLYSDWVKCCFSKKKEPPIFIYKGMTLALELLLLSSDSTKMPFLPAIRPPAPVIRVWIVTPQARLYVEP